MGHALMIQLLIKADQKQKATAHYNYYAELLHKELGVEPPAHLTKLIREIQAKSQPSPSPATSHPSAAPQISTAVRHNLPPSYDQFIGRQTVQQEIEMRLNQPWCRLVTIVGPGGMGKTRLATTIGRQRLPFYPDGVWLVELADIDPDDEDLAEAVAVEITIALNLRLSGSAKPADQLLTHLQHKQMLLILDNFEHLLEAGVEIVLDLLKRCEQLQLLVTSRELLQIRPEWAIPLNGLSYPTSGQDDIPSEAVALFVARWAQQQHGEVSPTDLDAIRTICQMVEGLPLAIELAAALTRHTSTQTVVAGLQDGFDMLTTTMRDVPDRHRGLDVVFEMSWRALSPTLQTKLSQLALFRGGFTPTAAHQITDTDLQQLITLSQKSLIRPVDETNRFTLHPVIQAYAGEKRPFKDPSLPKHSDYYLTLLTEQSEPLQQSAPQDGMAIIIPDIDNIRLAWQTGLAHQNITALRDGLTPFSIYYQMRGLAYEGESVMDNTRQTALSWGHDAIPLATHAELERARFQNRLGQHRAAIRSIEKALQLATVHDDRWAEGIGHVWWGEALWRLGEYDPAQEKLAHAQHVAQIINAPAIIGWYHHQSGIIDDIQSRYEQAYTHFEKACAIWQTQDNAQNLSNSLNSLGAVCYHQGNLPAAKRAMEQALELCNTIGNRHVQASLLNNLSIISTEQQDYAGSQYYSQLGLKLAITNGNLNGQGEIYNNLGINYLAQGKASAAAKQFKLGLQLSEQIGNPLLITNILINLGDTKQVQKDLGQAEFFYGQALNIARRDKLQNLECKALLGLTELLREFETKRAKRYSIQAVALAKAIQNPDLLKRAEKIENL